MSKKDCDNKKYYNNNENETNCHCNNGECKCHCQSEGGCHCNDKDDKCHCQNGEKKCCCKNSENGCCSNHEGKECHCHGDEKKCCCQNSENTCHCHNDKEHCCSNKPSCEKETDKIQNLTAQLEEWQNKYLRAYADAENSKRRAELDAKNLVDYKVSNFARDMLPLFDNLSLAIASIKDSVDENVLTGLKAVMSNFESSLKRNGITKIETIGKKFNPSEHRVVSQIESDAEPESIIQEFQSGWKLGDKVIREAMVATAKPKK